MACDGVVGFMIRGALGMFDPGSMACVSVQGPGSTFGWEAAISDAPSTRVLPLVDSEWVEIDARRLSVETGEAWLEHVFARHALNRVATLQREAACNAVHQVPERTANLLRRLHALLGVRDIRTTQAVLAQAIGVQRTSVNAALKGMERDGAVCLHRARVRVLDPARLERLSCGCQSGPSAPR